MAKKPAKPKRKKRPRPGQPPHLPTDETKGMVRALAAFGHAEEVIAEYIGIALNTLRKHYVHEIRMARVGLTGHATGKIARDLQSIDAWLGHSAAKYILSTLGKKYGWSPSAELTGPDGGAIPVRIGSLNDAQLDQLISRIQAG